MSEASLLCAVALMKEAELVGEKCLFEDKKKLMQRVEIPTASFEVCLRPI
jgi:hypothetical protein